MKTVSLGMDAEYLAVRLWKGRPWTSDVAVERRDRSGVRLPWPRAPRLEFAGGITLNFALTGDAMSAMPSGSLTAAQVDGLIAAGSPSVDLADPVTGRVWASGRWAVAYGAGSGGSGLIPTDGQTVVIVSNTITPVGGGGTGGVTSQQVQSMIDAAPYAPTSHTHDSRYVRTVNGTGPDGAGNVTVSGGGSVSDATTTTKGIVQLAGDLAGTADNPTVPGLADKADSDHTHTAADIGSGTLAIARIPTGTTSSTVALGNHTHSGYATSTHNHDSTYVKPADVQATPQTINSQTGTAYTLAAADAGKLVTLTNAAAITLTVPTGALTVGQRVDCVVAGAGMVTVVGGAGMTVTGTPSLVSRAQWSAFTVVALSASACVVIGDLA